MTILFVMTWAMLIFLAGMPIGQVIGLAALAPIAGYLAYIFMPHVTIRVNKFLNGTNDQADIAMESFSHGGLLGVGASEGVIKKYLRCTRGFHLCGHRRRIWRFDLHCPDHLLYYRGVTCFAHAQTSNIRSGHSNCWPDPAIRLQAAIHMASSVQLIRQKA